MSFHVPEDKRTQCHPLLKAGGDEPTGNNGCFQWRWRGYRLFCVASDGMGWEHVSVSIDRKRAPTWELMCHVKHLFWDAEDTVIQYHPPKSQYVNFHPYVLHLWRPIGTEIPLPDPILVGPK